jgi:hypothetical protein
VSVKGTAQASVRPDRALLSLRVSELDRDAATALERTAERCRALEHLLSDLAVPADQWSTSAVTVAEEQEWRQDHHEFVGYRATAAIQVSVRDLDQLGSLLSRAVAVARTQVAGPWWRVDDDNPSVVALLGAAALDGRRRAEAYATALGLRLGEVEAISEQPFEASDAPMAGQAMKMMASAPMGEADVPVNPGEVELVTEVFVRFALLPAR